ncbi:MAG: Trk system potassium transporter TrkA [Desulfarculales bacterium]|jgi:trk system potassium uptake protein TrkA|nr:Trk system potassium transporter TrkA [Desulfarculales bacterium]
MYILILGAGEVGFHTALQLSRENHNVVVVDHNPESLHVMNEYMDVPTLQGLASSPSILKEAGVREADLLIAVTNSDEVNLQACRFAKLISPSTTCIARVRNESYLNFMKETGLDHFAVDALINPEYEVARQISNLVRIPAVSFAADFAGGQVKLLGFKPPLTSPLVGRKMSDLHPPGAPEFLVAALDHGGKVVIPRGDALLRPGDQAYVVARREDLDQVLAHFGLNNDRVRKISLIGGGAISRQVALACRDLDLRVTIVVNDEEQGAGLAEEFPECLVLKGNYSDVTLWEEESLGQTDIFCAVTDNEEDNVLLALLGGKMGAGRTVARVANIGYVPLASSLGVDLVVSPRAVAAGAILRFLRRGKVLNISPLKDDAAEMMELTVQESSALVGRSLKDLALPAGILLTAVVRQEEIIIPQGNTVLRAGDDLVVFLMRNMVKKFEKLVSVKLEFF